MQKGMQMELHSMRKLSEGLSAIYDLQFSLPLTPADLKLFLFADV